MSLVVTGRSVLNALHVLGGDAPIDLLSEKLGADQAAILRSIQSLSAARLVASNTGGGSASHISLTEAGRKWCASEFKTVAGPAANPEAEQNREQDGRSQANNSSGINPLEKSVSHPKPIGANRMHGVEVVRVKRRQSGPEGNANVLVDGFAEEERRAAAEQASLTQETHPAQEIKVPPRPRDEPATKDEPALASAPTPQTPDAIPMAVPTTSPGGAKRTPRRPISAEDYTLDEKGFVTHINGRPIH